MAKPLLFLLFLLLPLTLVAETLADQLRTLAAQHQFTVSGLERTADSPAMRAQGELPQRLRAMLREYDFVLVNPPDGRVERLIILGRKGAAPPPPVASSEVVVDQEQEITLETIRSGEHHLVDAVLIGTRGERHPIQLLVDTGASSVVLPYSLVSVLGIDPTTLRSRQVQTANGVLTAGVTALPAMELAGSLVNDIETAFIDDDLLGGMALLGMSLLGRYRITLEDHAMTLQVRQ